MWDIVKSLTRFIIRKCNVRLHYFMLFLNFLHLHPSCFFLFSIHGMSNKIVLQRNFQVTLLNEFFAFPIISVTYIIQLQGGTKRRQLN